jgi:Short C-terminal domain/Phospholipase_D-nuclease N-terminal
MDDDFGLWEVFVSMFWFMLLFAWIWLLITILSDLFRDRELSGWWKAVWVFFIIILPWLGALVYLIARGASMNERARQAAQANEASFRAYVQDAAGSSGGGGQSTAEELRKLAELRDSGTISAEDYEKAKAKVLA